MMMLTLFSLVVEGQGIFIEDRLAQHNLVCCCSWTLQLLRRMQFDWKAFSEMLDSAVTYLCSVQQVVFSAACQCDVHVVVRLTECLW